MRQVDDEVGRVGRSLCYYGAGPPADSNRSSHLVQRNSRCRRVAQAARNPVRAVVTTSTHLDPYALAPQSDRYFPPGTHYRRAYPGTPRVSGSRAVTVGITRQCRLLISAAGVPGRDRRTNIGERRDVRSAGFVGAVPNRRLARQQPVQRAYRSEVPVWDNVCPGGIGPLAHHRQGKLSSHARLAFKPRSP